MKKNMIRNLLTALFLAVSIVYAMPFAAFAANADSGTVITPSGITSDQIESQVDSVVNEYIGRPVPERLLFSSRTDRLSSRKATEWPHRERTPVDPDETVSMGSVSRHSSGPPSCSSEKKV
jgi:hypothetical protein